MPTVHHLPEDRSSSWLACTAHDALDTGLSALVRSKPSDLVSAAGGLFTHALSQPCGPDAECPGPGQQECCVGDTHGHVEEATFMHSVPGHIGELTLTTGVCCGRRV